MPHPSDVPRVLCDVSVQENYTASKYAFSAKDLESKEVQLLSCVWKPQVGEAERELMVSEDAKPILKFDDDGGEFENGAFVLEWDKVQVLATNDVGFSWVNKGGKEEGLAA